jgi:ATP-dependent DNA helicase PIF1
VREHYRSTDSDKTPLKLIVSGTAGTGKSYLVQCWKQLLEDSVCVTAPTGAAAYNVAGYTLHSLLTLPVRAEFKELEGKLLQTLQESLAGVSYIIIDEMSMVGRKLFGKVDRRLRQVFPHRADQMFGGCSCILIGDWGQLPPVMDLPLYTTVSRSQLSDLGSANYHMFDHAVVLDHASPLVAK